MCDRLQPHQLDYDWRFTDRTAHELTSIVRGTRALLIGCPTVAEALAGRGKPAVLVDRQPAVTCKFAGTVIQADVRGEIHALRGEKFERVVLDSPWYPDDLLIWLDFALAHSQRDSQIYFSLWPDLTRPNAALEAEGVLEQLSRRGSVERHPQGLRYETPGFEHISTEGVGNEWRAGDLVCLAVKNPTPLGVWKPRLRPSWHRFAFGDYQIALQVPDKRADLPAISPIYRSWQLPSVSRRQTGVHKIQIWTSDNKVGAVDGGRYFYSALHGLVLGDDMIFTAPERAALQLLRREGFLADRIPDRRLEWEQFD